MSFTQEYQGRLSYRPEFQVGPYRLFVAVSCQVGGLEEPLTGMVDTAAEWCVLSQVAASRLGFDNGGNGVFLLSTRLGTFQGSLERLPLRLAAEEGESLSIEATWFVSPDWPGPLVLGWKGCLERFHFAFDTTQELLYFAAP